MEKAISLIIGEGDRTLFFVALLYAYVSAFLSVLMETTKREVTSLNTPYKFSYKFLFSDNSKRLVRSVILIFFAVRFSNEFFGQQLTVWLAVGIGFGFDKLSELIKTILRK